VTITQNNVGKKNNNNNKERLVQLQKGNTQKYNENNAQLASFTFGNEKPGQLRKCKISNNVNNS
jgi:hypothetical protein